MKNDILNDVFENMLQEEYQNLLLETKNHYEVEIFLKYRSNMSLYGDIFNKLRAIEGVTIVKVSEGHAVKKTGEGVKGTVLNIKFLPSHGMLAQYQHYLRAQIMKIKDEHNDKIIDVRFVSRPSLT